MKKVTFLFLGLVWCYSCYCQESRMSVGIEFAPTVNSLRGNTMVNSYNPLVGFSAGMHMEYGLSDKYSVKTGLIYEKKGAKSNIDYRDNMGNTVGQQDIKDNFNYLVLPILGSFSTHGNTKFYFDAGPYVGFLLSQKEIWVSSEKFPGQTYDFTDLSKKVDFGLSLGFGVKIPMKDHWSIVIGIKENLGLINTSKYLAVDQSSVRTNSFGLQLGLTYKL